MTGSKCDFRNNKRKCETKVKLKKDAVWVLFVERRISGSRSSGRTKSQTSVCGRAVVCERGVVPKESALPPMEGPRRAQQCWGRGQQEAPEPLLGVLAARKPGWARYTLASLLQVLQGPSEKQGGSCLAGSSPGPLNP